MLPKHFHKLHNPLLELDHFEGIPPRPPPKRYSCDIFINRASNLPTQMSLSNNTFVEIQQCGVKHRSSSINESNFPIWDFSLTLDLVKDRPLYFVIKHDGIFYNSEIAYGIIDLRKIDCNELTELSIPLFDKKNNAIYNTGNMIGNLYVNIRIKY